MAGISCPGAGLSQQASHSDLECGLEVKVHVGEEVSGEGQIWGDLGRVLAWVMDLVCGLDHDWPVAIYPGRGSRGEGSSAVGGPPGAAGAAGRMRR